MLLKNQAAPEQRVAWTPVNIEHLIAFVTEKDVRFLNGAWQLREALRNIYPSLQDLRRALQGNPLAIADRFREQLGHDPACTPENIEHLLVYAGRKDYRYSSYAIKLRDALHLRSPFEELAIGLQGDPLEVA